MEFCNDCSSQACHGQLGCTCSIFCSRTGNNDTSASIAEACLVASHKGLVVWAAIAHHHHEISGGGLLLMEEKEKEFCEKIFLKRNYCISWSPVLPKHTIFYRSVNRIPGICGRWTNLVCFWVCILYSVVCHFCTHCIHSRNNGP